jgi:hypothetical protein
MTASTRRRIGLAGIAAALLLVLLAVRALSRSEARHPTGPSGTAATAPLPSAAPAAPPAPAPSAPATSDPDRSRRPRAGPPAGFSEAAGPSGIVSAREGSPPGDPTGVTRAIQSHGPGELRLVGTLARAGVRRPPELRTLFEKRRQGANAAELRRYVLDSFPRDPALRARVLEWIAQLEPTGAHQAVPAARDRPRGTGLGRITPVPAGDGSPAPKPTPERLSPEMRERLKTLGR